MKSYDDLSLITALITAIVFLSAVIRFLYLENKNLNRKITQIYEKHKDDLKDAGKDVVVLTEKFQSIVEKLKIIIKEDA